MLKQPLTLLLFSFFSSASPEFAVEFQEVIYNGQLVELWGAWFLVDKETGQNIDQIGIPVLVGPLGQSFCVCSWANLSPNYLRSFLPECRCSVVKISKDGRCPGASDQTLRNILIAGCQGVLTRTELDNILLWLWHGIEAPVCLDEFFVRAQSQLDELDGVQVVVSSA